MKSRAYARSLLVLSLMTFIIGFPVRAQAFKSIGFERLASEYRNGKSNSLSHYVEYKTETTSLPANDEGDYVVDEIRNLNDHAAYRLVQTVHSSQTLKDTQGHSYWHREVESRPEPYYQADDVKKGYTLISSRDLGPNGYNELRHPASIINQYGSFPMLNDENQWVLINKANQETKLPIKGTDVNCAGFIADKYWLFSNAILGNHYTEYEFSDPESPESPLVYNFYADLDWTNQDSFLGGRSGYCLFNEDGSLFTKAALPESLMLKRLFFYPDMSKVIYSYTTSLEEGTYNEQCHGIILASINGKVIKQISGIDGDTMPWCRFLPGGKYVLLNNEFGLILLSRVTGDVIINIIGQVRVIDTESTDSFTVIFSKEDAQVGELIIYNYNKNKPTYVKQMNEIGRIRDFQVSPDGTEYHYNYIDYNNSQITKHYFRLDK